MKFSSWLIVAIIAFCFSVSVEGKEVEKLIREITVNEGFVDVEPVDAKRGVDKTALIQRDAIGQTDGEEEEKEEEEEKGPLGPLAKKAKKHRIVRASKAGMYGMLRQRVLDLVSQHDGDTRRATPAADSDSLAPAAEPASSTVPEAAAEAAPVVPIDDYTFDQMASDLKRMLAFIATHNEDRRTVETLERRVTSPVVGRSRHPGAPSAVLQRPLSSPILPLRYQAWSTNSKVESEGLVGELASVHKVVERGLDSVNRDTVPTR